jgi:hypothetical protein
LIAFIQRKTVTAAKLRPFGLLDALDARGKGVSQTHAAHKLDATACWLSCRV